MASAVRAFWSSTRQCELLETAPARQGTPSKGCLVGHNLLHRQLVSDQRILKSSCVLHVTSAILFNVSSERSTAWGTQARALGGSSRQGKHGPRLLRWERHLEELPCQVRYPYVTARSPRSGIKWTSFVPRCAVRKCTFTRLTLQCSISCSRHRCVSGVHRIHVVHREGKALPSGFHRCVPCPCRCHCDIGVQCNARVRTKAVIRHICSHLRTLCDRGCW